jgi:regulator of sirC expression with transglutaminase-like and TPR domain
MLDVLNRMLLVTPDASAELRERGLVYHRLECYRAALQDLSPTPSASPMRPDLDEACAASCSSCPRSARAQLSFLLDLLV